MAPLTDKFCSWFYLFILIINWTRQSLTTVERENGERCFALSRVGRSDVDPGLNRQHFLYLSEGIETELQGAILQRAICRRRIVMVLVFEVGRFIRRLHQLEGLVDLFVLTKGVQRNIAI